MKRKNTTKHMMKEYISKSLLILMSHKEYSSISINEITNKAGVNRSTYYRNFSSKDDIIKFFFSNIMQAYINDFNNSKDKSFENYMLTLFKHFYKYKKELLLIYKSGLAYSILVVLNDIFEKNRAETHLSIKDKYKLYYHTGGIYNFYLLWFANGMEEMPEELTKIALSVLSKNAKPVLIL